MLGRRTGRPGLLGTVARTAVVAGTATAVSGSMQRNAAQRGAQQQQAAAIQQQEIVDQAAAQASAQMQAQQPAAAPVDRISKLKELAALKDSGVLTEEEFAAEKAKVLAS
jgi:parvulin-like peptidyl-prolyl isomerase